MNKWNIKRKEINKFFKLKNGQWLKIVFHYVKKYNFWNIDIVLSDSKRQCNDCIRKTKRSPKVFYGTSTGKNTGLEPWLISLRTLLEFEKTLNYDTCIIINGATKRLENIYKHLERCGYTQSNNSMKKIIKR